MSRLDLVIMGWLDPGGHQLRLKLMDALSRGRIRQAIEETVKTVLQEELVRIEGVLREIDLDERTFIIRNPDLTNETRCKIPQDSDDLLEIAKEGLDHEVLVVGKRQKDPTRRQVFPLQIIEVEVLGKATESQDGMSTKEV